MKHNLQYRHGLSRSLKVEKIDASCFLVFAVCVLQLLDSAVYTLEQFLQSSARLQPTQVPVKLNRATERVLKVKKFIIFNLIFI